MRSSSKHFSPQRIPLTKSDIVIPPTAIFGCLPPKLHKIEPQLRDASSISLQSRRKSFRSLKKKIDKNSNEPQLLCPRCRDKIDRPPTQPIWRDAAARHFRQRQQCTNFRSESHLRCGALVIIIYIFIVTCVQKL